VIHYDQKTSRIRVHPHRTTSLVVIIGTLLAVIVPRAWRANVDAKYSLVRQNGSELAAYAQQWAEQMIQASASNSGASMTDYFNSLSTPGSGSAASAAWVAHQTGNNIDNWSATNDVTDRLPDAEVEASVEDIIPPERLPRNPFNGAHVFAPTNNPWIQQTVIPGTLACGAAPDSGFRYYAMLYQGTGSTEFWVGSFGTNPGIVFHAGQSTTISGLRNGVFVARLAL
jgi:type II secretory pathway pseudopilin PulG